jgi:rhamnosyl/mannosyltransferase
VVPLGIDPDPFTNATPLLESSDLPTILFIGRLRYYKGLEYLLEALKEIKARLIVGGNGPMRSVWERKMRELGLSNRVIFLGDIGKDDLPRLYASADIFVLPATMRSEAFGTVLLEAMAAGLPCVTTELGTGTSYVVQDGINGLIVPPKNSQALSGAINYLIANEEIRIGYGSAGKQRVRQNFTLNQMVTRVEEIYQIVLQTERI